MQEPFLSDANLFGTATNKIQIALPTTGVDFSQTMLPDATRNTICPPFQASVIVYSTAGVGSVIGTASIRWGGTQGISLQVAINIPTTTWCWTRWHARIGGQSIRVGNADMPPFTDPQWITGPVPSGCGTGSTATFEIRPNNPNSGITPSGTGAASWKLPGCGQPLYIALRLEMSTTGFTDAWIVPAVTGSPTGFIDGNGVAVPTCSSICLSRTFPIACSSNGGTSSTQCGSLQVTGDGNSLSLFFTASNSFSLDDVDVYVGKTFPNATGMTFSYTTGATYTETVYKPSPFISANAFTITYDLNRNIADAQGVTISCGDAMQLSVAFNMTQGSTPFKGVMNTATRISGQWSFYDSFTRCCTTANLNACGNNNLCFPTFKFRTTFGWSRSGSEVLWNRCCALDPILDVVLSLLPEGIDNRASGLVPGNVSAVCNFGPGGAGTPCTMAMTFIYQASSYRNLIGYYFYNTLTGQLTYTFPQLSTAFDRGLVSVWPDATMQNNPYGGGCLVPGDTMVITVPPNTVVGWFMRSNGHSWFSKNGNSAATDVFPSIFSPTGFNSADGANHFGWININGLGTNTFLFGVEDLAGLGDKDFNDVVFGFKLNGNWNIPGLPAYDPCTGNLVSRCLSFVPASYANFIFSPSCISHIVLDTGVGTTLKDCTGYYTIPAGWTIAPMDELGISTARTYASVWRSPCVVGLNPNGPGYIGYNAAGLCTPTVATITDPSDPFGVAPCYSLACTGQLLLRQITQTNTACNALTSGLYCDPDHPGGFYTVASSSSPTSLYISMVPGGTLNMPVYAQLFNRLQVFVLMDTNGISSSPVNDITNLATTVRHLSSNSGSFKAFAVGFGITNPDGTISINCAMSYNSDLLSNPSVCPLPAPSNTFNTNANLLDGLTNLLNRQPLAFGWQANTPRVVYAVTKSVFATAPSSASINAFRSAMVNSGISVVFVPATTAASNTLKDIISNNNIPRAVVSDVITYPDLRSPNNALTAAFSWQSVAYRALITVVGQIDVIKGTDSPSFTTTVPQYSIPNFGAFPDPNYSDFSLYTINPGISVTLPSNYLTQSLPRTITWTIPQTITSTGALTTFQTLITWNVPPALVSDPLTYNFNDASTRTFTFNVVDPMRNTLDPNGNPYDVVFLSSTFSPSVPSTGFLNLTSIVTVGGPDAGKPFELNKRYNIVGLRATALASSYGRWILTYRLFDGCLSSTTGTIQVTFSLTNVLPTCRPVSLTIPFGSAPVVLDLSEYFRDTPMTCSPQYIPTNGVCHSSVPTGCSACVNNTDCCATGTTAVRGSCTRTLVPDCPDGSGSYLCAADGCPYTSITCRPINSTCTSAFCYGFTECTTACPSGFQNGMFCIVNPSNVADMRICCAQTQYSQAGVTINNPSGTGVVATAQFRNGNTWANVNSGSRNTLHYDLRFVLNPGIVGSSIWRYAVRTRNNIDTSGTCNINITVPAPSAPPTIGGSLTTINLVTPPGEIGTWNIPVSSSDPSTRIRLVISNTAQPDYNRMFPSRFGIQNATAFPDAGPIIPRTGGTNFVLTEVSLNSTGMAVVPFQWSPNLSFPYGQTNTIVIRAMDGNGLLSTNTVTVNLRIPNNVAPTWEAGFQPAAVAQYSPAFDITVQGFDTNLQDTASLRLFFTQSANSLGGTLQLVRPDTTTLTVATGTTYAFSLATGAVANKTTYRLRYIPSQTRGSSTQGTEIWYGHFLDPSSLQGAGNITIRLTPVPTPPTTSNVEVSTAKDIVVPLTIPGASVDGTLRTLIITGINLANPGATTLTFNGQPVAVNNVYNLTSASVAGTWTFNYVSTVPLNGNDTITYVVRDTNNLNSTTGTGTIIGLSNLQTPQVRDFTVSGTQGTTIPVNFNWGPFTNATNVYFDGDTAQSLTTIFIASLPTLGTLGSTSGATLSVGSSISVASLNFVAPPFSVATQTFQFFARDNTLQNSPTATVTINLTPTKVAPTLTMTPGSATRARGQTANFVMTVIDSNTDTINVDLSAFSSFPFRCATPSNTTANVGCSTLTLSGAGIPTPIALSSAPTSPYRFATIDNTNQWGTPHTITATWEPGLNYFPDSKIGSFSVTASNAWGNSPTRTGNVAVSNNAPPTIVEDPAGTYTITALEGASPIQTIFTAWDSIPGQTGALTFKLVTEPNFGVKVTTEAGVQLVRDNVIGPAPANGVDTKTITVNGNLQLATYAPMRVVLPQYWYGTTNFTFLATDPLGANSAIQTVTITVTPVNNAPIVPEVIIVVRQNSCTFLSCATITPPVYSTAPITAFEPDLTAPGDSNTLTFSSLPASGSGVLGWFTPFVPLTITGPLAAPGGVPTWPIIYQPEPWTKNTDCLDETDWESCEEPFLTIPFTVTDRAGLSDTADLKIYILPVNHAPATTDVTRQADFQEPLSVPVVGTDPDSNLQKLVIVSVNLKPNPGNPTTFTGPDNAPVVPGSEYLITTGGSSSNTWTFTYETSLIEANTDSFTYYVVDTKGLVSPTRTGLIHLDQIFIDPLAEDDSFTLAENSQLQINFVYGDDPLVDGKHRFSEIDLSTSPRGRNTRIVIKSLPSNGKLTRDGSAVSVNSVIELGTGLTDPWVLYTPNFLWNGEDQFDFTALDINLRESLPATMTLTVTPVNQPPQITLSPTPLLVDRASSRRFTVTVFDVDSPVIEVYIAATTGLTGELVDLVYSDFTLRGTDKNVVLTYTSTEKPTSGLLYTVVNTVFGVQRSFELEWAPKTTAPDGTTGDITIYANDGTDVSAERPTGTVQVTPNIIPVTVENPTGSYKITVNQNSGNVQVRLQASDLDPWHDKLLSIKLTQMPSGGVSIVGAPALNTPLTIDDTVASGTTAPIELSFTTNWHGTTSFNFTATDLLGAVSQQAVVTVIVNRVNQIPETQDVTIVVPEDSCVFGCPTPTSSPVSITCDDFEDDILLFTLQVAEIGSIGRGPVGSITRVTSVAGVNGACPFTVWYQPPPLTNSNCAEDFNPVTGDGCDIFTTVPFTICDTEGACVPANVKVIVTPINHPPVTYNYFSTLREVELTVEADDHEDNIVRIEITGVTITEPSKTTITYDGTPITPGRVIIGDGSGWEFSYLNTGYLSVTDSFTYIVYDSDDAPSNEGKTTIQPPLVIFPPEAWGARFSVPEGKAVDIPFRYGSRSTTPDGAAPTDPAGNYFDFSGSQAQAQLIIKSLPAIGTISDINGRLLAIDDVLPSPTVVYQSVWDFSGEQSFDFVTYNPATSTSGVATMIIDVTHVNRPPVISLNPLYNPDNSATIVTADRLSRGVLLCTASDVDSPTIDVVLTKIDLPFGLTGRLYSSFTIEALDGTIIQDFNTVPTNLTDGTIAITLAYEGEPGGDLSFNFVWTPTNIAPDGTAGTFSAFARDDELLTSSEVKGAVAVTPNRPPVVLDTHEPSHYTVKLIEDGWPSHVILLEGTDPDRWHQQNLTFVLTSLPEGVILTQGSDTAGATPIIFTNLPLTVDNPSAIVEATRASVNIFPILGWSGTTHFDFYVRDLLGAVSAPQRVHIEIEHVNHPPISRNETLVVPQNFCVLPDCGAPEDLSSFRHVVLDATDPDWVTDDTDSLTLKLEGIPDPDTVGVLVYFVDGVLTILESPTDFPRVTIGQGWPFWFQPVTNLRSECTDPAIAATCTPVVSLPFRIVDQFGQVSLSTYQLDLIVTPVNQPPWSQDLIFNIPQNTELVIYFDNDESVRSEALPVWDTDNTDEQISAQALGIVTGSRGSWHTSTGNVVPASGNTFLPGRYLRFTPVLNTFSLPGEPYATLIFNVYDQQPLFSTDNYRITVVVDHVCLPIRWTGPRRVETLEETAVAINLHSPDFWESPNPGKARIRLLTGPKNDKGYFFECTPESCYNLTSFPYEVAGTFFYVPPLDENGPRYTTFDFDLMILDPQDRECPGADVSITFIIDVIPVNDPPILVPLWFPGNPLVSECAEDTFVKLRFTAWDVDNTCDELLPQILTLLDPLSGSLYGCNSTNLINNTGAFNCSDGHPITSIEYVHQYINLTLVDGAINCTSGDVLWEISVIPYPNWNGNLRLLFLVWDLNPEVDRFSQTEIAKVRVWPVNDAPSIVRDRTFVDLERYNKENDEEGYQLVGTALSSVEFTVYAGHAEDERELEGEVLSERDRIIVERNRQKSPELSRDLNSTESLIYRVRTQVQDIDFFFSHSLILTGRLINAEWVDPTLLARAYKEDSTKGVSCDFTRTEMNCTGVIGPLNFFLATIGFPFILDENATVGYGLFTLNDLGNVDIYDRPLETNFTIAFQAPSENEIGVPIAAVAVLPIVAAVSAASIAAAWILFGKKAAAAVGTNFDAFTCSNDASAHASPLYSANGREHNSPLYAGRV